VGKADPLTGGLIGSCLFDKYYPGLRWFTKEKHFSLSSSSKNEE
jgi:hypothetical protein